MERERLTNDGKFKKSDGWSRVLGKAMKQITIWLFESRLTLAIEILRRKVYVWHIVGAQNNIEKSS